jgi:hypothetical protein
MKNCLAETVRFNDTIPIREPTNSERGLSIPGERETYADSAIR